MNESDKKAKTASLIAAASLLVVSLGVGPAGADAGQGKMKPMASGKHSNQFKAHSNQLKGHSNQIKMHSFQHKMNSNQLKNSPS